MHVERIDGKIYQQQQEQEQVGKAVKVGNEAKRRPPQYGQEVHPSERPHPLHLHPQPPPHLQLPHPHLQLLQPQSQPQPQPQLEQP